MNRGFVALLVTQFLGAANDNVLKTVLVFVVVSGVWAGQLGDGGQGIVSLCMFLPFVLFSGYGGQLADRYSKTWMSVRLKLLEIPIALVALLGFALGNLWITMAAMWLLAMQSAFFGPAKYGMIPELVEALCHTHARRRHDGAGAAVAARRRAGRDRGGRFPRVAAASATVTG
jgi:acyl-[acyl-carrier-protein]-phospholipid O-acyltransferase/long-chain-fatty-acid--[acyl-carrier-protein] ligase